MLQEITEFYNPEALEDVNVDALLPLFARIQRLIKHSSFAFDIKEDSDRFDERIDSSILVQRDQNDQLVTQEAKKILTILKNLFSDHQIDSKLPKSNLKKPILAVFNVEVKNLTRLINVMVKSVEDLLQHIQGVYQKPVEIERLWEKI